METRYEDDERLSLPCRENNIYSSRAIEDTDTYDNESDTEELNVDKCSSVNSEDYEQDIDETRYSPEIDNMEFSPTPRKFRADGKKHYTCQECKYITDRKNNLKRHVVTMHEKCTKLLECCDQIFCNKASLREHVVSCHKKGYDCRICGRNFCRKALLKRHITVHSGQKDFVCNVCGYATSHKSNLDRHKRRHIPKELRNRFPIEKTGSGRRRSGREQQPFSRIQDYQKMVLFEPHATENSFPALFGSPFNCFAPSIAEYSFMRSAIPRPQWTTQQKVPFKRWMLPEEEGTSAGPSPSEERNAFAEMVTNKSSLGIVNGISSSMQVYERSDRPKEQRKRLFPALHKCKGCEMIFDHQLELCRHVDEEHPIAGMIAPQRPLTLLIRPAALVPWRYF